MHPHFEEDSPDDLIPWEERKFAKMPFYQEKAMTALTQNYDRLRKAWLLRALQCCRVRQTLDDLLKLNGSKKRRLLEYLELITPAAPLPTEITPLLTALDQAWSTWQQQPPIERRGRPFNIIAALGQELNLNAAEREIVLFTAMLKGDPLLRQGVNLVGEINPYEVRDVLAAILELTPEDIRQALAIAGMMLEKSQELQNKAAADGKAVPATD